MAQFINPFMGNVPRKMEKSELERAIMANIAAELEAVHLYLSHMDATDDEDAKKVLYDIALEEMVHAGEFTSLLYRLSPVAAIKAREGFDEVRELLGGRAPVELEAEAVAGNGSTKSPGEQQAPGGNLKARKLTVGSLKNRP